MDAPRAPWPQAVEASITPLRSKTNRGQSCRRLKAELTRGSSHDEWTGWFCKQADGRWKSRKVGDD